MYVTFRNISTSEKMIVSVENQRYTINPENSAEVFVRNESFIFEAQSLPFEELTDAISDLETEVDTYRLKDKVFAKLVKKFAEKLPEAVLNVSVKYEASFTASQNPVIDLKEGIYSVCDGKIADAFDMMPVGFMFSRAEAQGGNLKVVDATATNCKKFLKLMRNILLFSNWGLLFLDLFLFIPEYLAVKFLASEFYIKKLFISLYSKSSSERSELLYRKEQLYEKEEEKKGCLGSILKVIIALILIGGICCWAMTSEPDVIISEDFSEVICFDEVFVKTASMPSDAKDVFLEDYTAYYPLSDGGYDMDNYYCYIYETPDGTRYMWLKDNCSDEENKQKDFADYENPMVYKSVGEKE